ncbi:CST complex subunit STN1 [Arapaima gigas]
MQGEQGQDEPPSLLWGLDPVFSAHARLYITDILRMRESYQVPGTYFYKNHPVFKVDVLGTVVYKREREDFFCYGVDDGTGVISCLCWKDERWRNPTELGNSRNSMLLTGRGIFHPAKQLKKLKEAQNVSSCLEIGDLLRVRGCVKTSRQQREVKAFCYYKVNDPVMAAQISWMMEVPQLYQKVYDKPFDFTKRAQELNLTDSNDVPSSLSLLQRASKILKGLLSREAVECFRPKDVEHVFIPLVTQNTSEQLEPGAVQSSSKHLFQETIKALQDEGLVFRKVVSQDEVYQEKRVCLFCFTDAERGCHVLHILSCVRHTYSRNVSRPVIEVVLRCLECESEIISTAEDCYTTF